MTDTDSLSGGVRRGRPTLSRQRPVVSWCLVVMGAVGAFGCDSGARVMGPEPAELLAIVSDPSPSFSTASERGVVSVAASASAEVVFVSLPRGAVPAGQLATIQNPRAGSTVQTALVAGGFDPVAVPAVVGDTLHIEVSVSGSGGPIRFSRAVPPRRRPIVVRTDPPPGKRDVPLNASLVIVFSEPIDPQSLTGAAIQLLQDELPVAGRLELRDPDRVVAEFVPVEPLAAADYELVVTQGVRDLDGESLETPVVVEFTTQLPPPGGEQIAFVHSSSGTIGISLVNADGSGLVRLTRGPGAATDPVWSPDGTRLAYRTDRDGKRDGSDTGNYWAIYVLGPDGSRRLTSDPVTEGGPVWSPDGGRIAFVTVYLYNWGGMIRVVNSDGSGAVTLTTFDVIDAGWVDSRPGWSPDGQRLVFERHFFWPYISVMKADGSDFAVLQDGVAPAWSPDGARIAYAIWGDEGGIFVMEPDGSGLVRLTRGPGAATDPVWSPDGTRIAFVGNAFGWIPGMAAFGSTPGEIYVMNADGSGLIRVTPSGPVALYPAWSPDGREIAFTGSLDGRWEIYVVGADGSGLRRLTHSPPGVSNWGPVWRPRGGR